MPTRSAGQRAFHYVNRKGDIYFAHRIPAGKRPARFVMSRSSSGALHALPGGYEVVETPNGQVSIRATPSRLITHKEEVLVTARLATLGLADYRVEIKKRDLIIHAPDGPDDESVERMMNPWALDPEDLLAPLLSAPKCKAAATAAAKKTSRERAAEKRRPRMELTRYSPILRFHLPDTDERLFIISRMCFRGQPHWLELDELPLAEGCDRYFPHPGRESFFELHCGGPA